MAPKAQPLRPDALASALQRLEGERRPEAAIDLQSGPSKLLPLNVLHPVSLEQRDSTQERPEEVLRAEVRCLEHDEEVPKVEKPKAATAFTLTEMLKAAEQPGEGVQFETGSLVCALERHLQRHEGEQARRHEEVLAQLSLLQARQGQQHMELLRQFESSHEAARQGRESVVSELQQQQEHRQQQEERWQQLLEAPHPQPLRRTVAASVYATNARKPQRESLGAESARFEQPASPSVLRRSLPEYESESASHQSQRSQGAAVTGSEDVKSLQRSSLLEPRRCEAVGVLNCGSMVVALLGVVVAGLDAELGARASEQKEAKPVWLWWARFLLTAAFSAELTTRATLQRRSFARSCWNWVELVLLLSAWVSCSVATLDLTVLRVFLVLRLPHSLQGSPLRDSMTMKQLRLASEALAGSCSTLCCAVVIAMGMLYAAAVVFLQLVADHMSSGQYYGSLQRTMVSLAMALSGGLDWEELLGPLRAQSPIYAWAFFVFFAAALLLGLSVYIAVFAYTVSQLAQHDEAHAAQREREREQEALAQLKAQLPRELTRPALQQLIRNEEQFLGLSPEQVLWLWELLESAGHVDREDFMAVLLRLKDSAKAVDVATVMRHSQQVYVQVSTLMRFVETEFNQVAEDLQRLLHGLPAGAMRERSTMETYEPPPELLRKTTATSLMLRGGSSHSNAALHESFI